MLLRLWPVAEEEAGSGIVKVDLQSKATWGYRKRRGGDNNGCKGGGGISSKVKEFRSMAWLSHSLADHCLHAVVPQKRLATKSSSLLREERGFLLSLSLSLSLSLPLPLHYQQPTDLMRRTRRRRGLSRVALFIGKEEEEED